MSRPVVLAAGAALWRRAADGTPETLLVHRPRYDDWSLPKGKNDPGEHLTATAVREVAEETGLGVSLGRPLGQQRYRVLTKTGSAAHKRVSYWAAAAVRADGGFVPNEEVDEVAWLGLDDARARLTWPRDTTVLDALAAGPLATTPIVLLRHATAISRGKWRGTDDEARPLSPQGRRQAAHLVAVLGAYGIRRVLSSPAARCLGTVTPFAGARGLTVETAYALTERGGERDVSHAVTAFADLLGGGVPAVLCTHRPLLPVLADLVGERLTAPALVLGKPLEKGEMLVAHVAAPAGGAPAEIVAAERHRT